MDTSPRFYVLNSIRCALLVDTLKQKAYRKVLFRSTASCRQDAVNCALRQHASVQAENILHVVQPRLAILQPQRRTHSAFSEGHTA